jgi:ATP-dependent Clp protease ATP-binding subunit ClpC
VLLGLLKLAKGSFANVLRTMNVDREAVRVEVERLVWPVPAQTVSAGIPLTPRAQKALRLAAREATVLKHSSIGAEHLFLGLLLEGGGVGARVLKKLGIRSEKARQEIVSELRAHPS